MNTTDFFQHQPPTPLTYLTTVAEKRIYLKHDYLNHPTIQGNKLRKLKYNLLAAQENAQTLVSFGGAYSNHIAALAAAGKAFGLPTVGIIRGDELAERERWSHTLQTAHEHGMQLHFVSRTAYRGKANHPDIADIIQSINKARLIPEGGSNTLAVQGCMEIMAELNTQQSHIDAVFAACGTGGTLAGLIDGAFEHNMACRLHGIAVLKGADFLRTDIAKLSQQHEQIDWQLYHDYHVSGYAKTTPQLLAFINEFHHQHAIPLEPIYTGKLFAAVFDLAKNSDDKKTENWVIYHSGGLQGIDPNLSPKT